MSNPTDGRRNRSFDYRSAVSKPGRPQPKFLPPRKPEISIKINRNLKIHRSSGVH
jgi:hypothetical protein